MLDILDIEKAVPEQHLHISEAASALQLSRTNSLMYDRFFGLKNIPSDPEQTILDMSKQALRRLWEGHPKPEFVVHCHTLLSAGPLRSDSGHPVTLFKSDDTEVFSATMCHCAGGVAVFEMLDGILSPEGTALVLISDKAFHPAVQHIQNTTIMGDGAIAMLVGRGAGRFRHIASSTSRHGAYSVITGLVGEETDLDFADEYISMTVACIQQALENADVDINTLRFVFPHNVNIPSWETIAKGIGAERDQIYLKNIPNYGHTFGADPFLNLLDADREGALQPGDHVALVSVGLGATASCAIFQVNAAKAEKSEDLK